jgi:predicted MFS family arabinose efflux permease
MLRTLAPLTFGALVMGTGSLVVAGILQPIANDLVVSVALVGQLTPAYALAFAIAAPIISVLAARFDRKTVLIASLLAFAAASVAGAMVSTFEILLLTRIIAGIAGAAFTPNAIAVGAALVPATHRGQAISLVFGGFTLAAVVGVPAGMWLGLHLGWRQTLFLVAGLALMAALLTAKRLSAGVRLPPADLKKWVEVLHDRIAMLMIATTMVSIAGTYAVFSYIGPYLSPVAGGDADRLALLVAVFGAAGLVGNLLSGRMVDRIGAAWTVKINQLGVAAGLAVLYFGNGHFAATIVGLIVWGGTVFSINTAQQARLIAHAPSLQGVLLPANSSLLYVGQFLGGALGGLTLHASALGLAALPLIGISLVLIGIMLSCASDAKRKTLAGQAEAVA